MHEWKRYFFKRGKVYNDYGQGFYCTELVQEILEKSGLKMDFAEPQVEYECSPEYWCGWSAAYYQWYTGRSFQNIHQNISMEKIEKLYPTLHEASEEKFVDMVNQMIQENHFMTPLQALRKACGYSQRELAEKAGVNIRNIQQYEQRAKDINKAAAQNVFALARVLGCRPEDLLEY